MKTLLAVHPHPDDESIGVGGSLVKYAGRGVATHVVTCTGGEAGENLAGIDLEGRPMAQVRREEMADAAEVLCLASHTWLGFRDSGMADTEDNGHPDAFVNAELEVAAARLATQLRQRRPDVVISDDEHGTYGHPDHVMAHRVTVAAVAMAADPDADLEGSPHRVGLHAAYTVSRQQVQRLHDELLARDLLSPFDDEMIASFGTSSDEITTVLDVREQLPVKRAAMLAHRSQVSEDSAFFNIPDDLADQAFGHESFMIVSSAEPVDETRLERLARDLFEGALP